MGCRGRPVRKLAPPRPLAAWRPWRPWRPWRFSGSVLGCKTAVEVRDFLTERGSQATPPVPLGSRKVHMYAVIKTGGKQYRVSEGQKLRVERLPGNPGDAVNFDQVLLVGGDAPQIGRPLVSGAIGQRRNPRPGSGEKDHRLQASPPQELPAQAGPSSALHRAEDHRASRPRSAAMAHKKGAGSTRNGRGSNAQRRGVKVYAGTPVARGQHPRSAGRARRSMPARTSAPAKTSRSSRSSTASSNTSGRRTRSARFRSTRPFRTRRPRSRRAPDRRSRRRAPGSRRARRR